MTDKLTKKLADRLKRLRQERGWSLDRLAEESGLSRATLSRLEKAEVSPTAEVLSKLCRAYALAMSRLLAMVEENASPVVRRRDQLSWHDEKAGFLRRAVSPPDGHLAAEVLECELKAGARIAYKMPPLPGLEHHLVLLEGSLDVTIEGQRHRLTAGDCLRYRLFGASAFETSEGSAARYLLVLV